MSDRERSRSPDRGDPPADSEKDFPPAGGDDKYTDTPQDGGGDGAPANNSGDGAGAGGGDEVKLYVGNLDYGTLVSSDGGVQRCILDFYQLVIFYGLPLFVCVQTKNRCSKILFQLDSH